MHHRLIAPFRCLAAALTIASCHADVIERAGVRVEFPPNAKDLAEESAETLAQARLRYAGRLPKSPALLKVVICGSYDHFKEYAGPLSTYSVLGVALPEHDLIVLKAPVLAPPGSDFKGTVRHELVHILLRHNFNTANLPRWLNEGIAMVFSGENRWESRSTVASMYLSGRILSYRDLERSFLDPGREIEFGDAYAQAYSMTQYLMDELGEDRFWGLMRSLDSRTFGAALEAELGKVPYDFWEAWKRALAWSALTFSVVSGILLFQIMALLTVLAYWRKWKRGQRLLREWDEEETQETMKDM